MLYLLDVDLAVFADEAVDVNDRLLVVGQNGLPFGPAALCAFLNGMIQGAIGFDDEINVLIVGNSPEGHLFRCPELSH